MKNPVRNVVVPTAAAAVAGALLVVVGADIARADETAASEPAVIAVASIPVDAGRSKAVRQSVRTGGADDFSGKKPNGIERRCERTGRIGKFHITRCD